MWDIETKINLLIDTRGLADNAWLKKNLNIMAVTMAAAVDPFFQRFMPSDMYHILFTHWLPSIRHQSNTCTWRNYYFSIGEYAWMNEPIDWNDLVRDKPVKKFLSVSLEIAKIIVLVVMSEQGNNKFRYYIILYIAFISLICWPWKLKWYSPSWRISLVKHAHKITYSTQYSTHIIRILYLHRNGRAECINIGLAIWSLVINGTAQSNWCNSIWFHEVWVIVTHIKIMYDW